MTTIRSKSSIKYLVPPADTYPDKTACLRGSALFDTEISKSGLYPHTLLLRFGLSIAAGFAAVVVAAVSVGFLAWFVVDLVVTDPESFGTAGSIVLRIAVLAAFAAGAGIGSFVFCLTSPRRGVDEEASPTEAVAAGAGLLLLVAMALASGMGLVVFAVSPFVLFGGLLGSRSHDRREPSSPRPRPYEMLEAA